jgi:hypothetical protein
MRPCEGAFLEAYASGIRSVTGWKISMTEQVLWINHSLRCAEWSWQEVGYRAICSSETSEHLTTTRAETQKKTVIWSYILYFNSVYFICLLICIVLFPNKTFVICFATYKICLKIKPPGLPDFPYFFNSIESWVFCAAEQPFAPPPPLHVRLNKNYFSVTALISHIFTSMLILVTVAWNVYKKGSYPYSHNL